MNGAPGGHLRPCDAIRISIGETGFEPATARPPAGCATRLRHSPWTGKPTAASVRTRCERVFAQTELGPELRRCCRCGELKPVDEFSWRRRDKGERDTHCRPCRSAYGEEHYAA